MTLLGVKAPSRPDAVGPRRPRWATFGVCAVVLLGVVARFSTRSHLWLDEALTVNIANLPLGDIPGGLRYDGSPPLFYLLLHGWMRIFGSDDLAVRTLSGLTAIACLPLSWAVGRRLGGRKTAWVAMLFMASSPFAIRYATEVRMYSLLLLLSLVATLALLEVLRIRSPAWSATLAVSTGALLLTHYWAFYVVAAVGAGLLLALRRADSSTLAGIKRSLVAIGLGCLTFLPWLPNFVHQVTTNGTPWGRPPTPRVLFGALLDFSGGYPEASLALGLLAYGLCGFGVFGKAGDDGHVHMDLKGRDPGRVLALVVGTTLVLGVLIGQVTGSAFAIRYAAVVFPLVVMLMALGVNAIPGTRMLRGAVAVTVVLGFATAMPGIANQRTTAGRVASVLEAKAGPGDLVTYCPDQLGPSVSRLAPEGLVHLTFPRAAPPQFMNWTDYGDINRAARAEPFAEMLLERAGPDHDIWVVWAPGYRTFGLKCQALITALREARPVSPVEVKISRSSFERPGLVRFPAQ